MDLETIPLKEAQNIAVEICYQLEPFCEKINIAGSVRRKKQEVKDIEIVCVPKLETQYDMFGTPFSSGRNTGFRDVVLSLGEIIKGGGKRQVHANKTYARHQLGFIHAGRF